MNQEEAIEAAACIYLSNWRDRPPSEQEWVMDSTRLMVRAYLEARAAYTEPPRQPGQTHNMNYKAKVDAAALLLADFGEVGA